jgi:glucan endo-1,3-alpha-glucosidase
LTRVFLTVIFAVCLIVAASQTFPIVPELLNHPHPPQPPVFSWYMTPFYTYFSYAAGSGGDPASDAIAVAGYKHDIQDAQASGVDGFALYIGNQQYLYTNTRNMFEAAKELHNADPSKPPFLLFLAPENGAAGDVAQIFPGTSTNWMVYFMNAFAAHPNYYHYRGKAVLGSFLGLDQQSDWVAKVFTPLHNQGIDVFFVPSVFDANAVTTDGTHFNAWAQANIGSLTFWTGDVPGNDIGATNSLANINQVNSKPVVVNLSGANYWSVNNSASAGVYFEHNGGEGPDQEWRNAISLNPIFIIETTWNDYTESYTTPVDIPNVPTIGTGYKIEQLLKPHAGYNELRKRYAQWYKTGVQPTVTKDLLIYFYRTHAKNLVASSDTRVTTFNPDTSGETVPDDLFVTTELTAPATLRVTTGGVVTTYSMPAGVTFTRIPFSAGAQTFEVIRGDVTTISTSGEAILSSITEYNYEYTTGFAYAD